MPDTSSAEATVTPVRQADVVVCGAGIAGLAVAHALRDLDVVVLEADAAWEAGCARSAGTACGSTSAATSSQARAVRRDRLISGAGVQAVPVPGRLAAVELGGRVVASGRGGDLPAAPAAPADVEGRARASGCTLRIAVARYAALAAPVPGEPDATRQERMLGFMDDRTLQRVRRAAARRRRRPLPGDAHALVGRAGGAAGGLRRRVLPPRVGSIGRAVAQHPRRVGDADRRARRAARRSRAPGRARQRGRAGCHRRDGRVLGRRRGSARARPGGSRRDARVRHARRSSTASRRDTTRRAARDPVRPLRRRRVSHARDPADAVGRHLRARDAAPVVQHALQHGERPAATRRAALSRGAA